MSETPLPTALMKLRQSAGIDAPMHDAPLQTGRAVSLSSRIIADVRRALNERRGPMVIVSASDDAGTIRHCLDCGASGFIPKSQPVEAIRDAIRKIMGGEVWLPPDLDLSNVPTGETAELVSRLSTLTPQQVRVLMMLGEGLLNKQIAFKLSVSEATIKAHVSAILQKLGVDSRTQAVIAISKIGASTDWPRLPN